MLRMRMNKGSDAEMILLGIDAANVDRLRDGKPILIERGGELGLPAQLCIVYGDTLLDVLDILDETGRFDEADLAVMREAVRSAGAQPNGDRDEAAEAGDR